MVAKRVEAVVGVVFPRMVEAEVEVVGPLAATVLEVVVEDHRMVAEVVVVVHLLEEGEEGEELQQVVVEGVAYLTAVAAVVVLL